MAQALLERNGVQLNIGDVGLDDLTPEVMTTEGPQPKDVAARVVAHLGHRIPGVRRFEKRLEGRDKSSGILSDIGVLAGQLYYRNKKEIDRLAGEVLAGKLQSKRRSKSKGSHVDFGLVGDPVSPNGRSDHA